MKHILITGANRSGSTWVGRVLASNALVDNIIEPLNLNRIKRFKRVEIDVWYLKLDKSSSLETIKEAKSLFDYYLNTSFYKVLCDPFASYEGHGVFKSIKKRIRRASKPVKMLKDPMALFSVPWLNKEYNILPIIIIRHPAAYVLSVREKNWWFDFDNFIKQENFFKGELNHLLEEVMEFKRDEKQKSIIENAALFWKVCYEQVVYYQEKYPDWFYIKHEVLSIETENIFGNMFNYLQLDFNTEVKKYIRDSTNAKVETQYNRNSSENSKKWVGKLTENEKEIIYSITHSVSDKFYDKFV